VAVPLHGEVDGRGNLRLVRDVAARVGSVGTELRGDGAAKFVLHVGDDDLGAVPDELGGRRLADAARGARDDRHFTSEPLTLRARGRGEAIDAT
jgi:hypothetical protein